MHIKVNYDPQTTLVKGYYPDSINHASIPEPCIEISEEEHQEGISKQMCVIDGVYQEYVTPDSLLVEQSKQTKTAQFMKNNEKVMQNLGEIKDKNFGKIKHPHKIFCINCVLIVFGLTAAAIACVSLFHFLTN